MDENAQETVNLMEASLEMRETDFNANEEDGDFWTYALEAMQTNAQIIRQANARVAESWGELAKEASRREEITR
jgi:hypothetical protein